MGSSKPSSALVSVPIGAFGQQPCQGSVDLETKLMSLCLNREERLHGESHPPCA